MILNNLILSAASNIVTIKELIKNILNIILPILILIATAIAIIMTIIIFISGMKDINGIERKQKIQRLVWIWVCYAGVFLSSTIILIIYNLFGGTS